jgi:hypothetical protein
MNHPPSEVIYALPMTRLRSIMTWITSSSIPYSFALSTYNHNINMGENIPEQ